MPRVRRSHVRKDRAGHVPEPEPRVKPGTSRAALPRWASLDSVMMRALLLPGRGEAR